ncbi:MAG: alkaline phosphatase PhoX [Pirellulaceae bacterium]
MPHPSSRRSFLHSSAALLGGAAFAAPFESFAARRRADEKARHATDFGKLAPVKDKITGLPLIQLPEGFEYLTFGWEKDKLTEGGITPAMHDGMAVIASDANTVTLCRNHEVDGSGKAFGSPEIAYDPQAAGGCTNLVFNTKEGKLVKSWSSISGTVRNCAGGPTPWGTWLTCEETLHEPGVKDAKGRAFSYEKTHGWIFDVPATAASEPQPLKAMGRFVHEAIAIDPTSGIVYETEDKSAAGFYRFLPSAPGHLAEGGKLQMMKVKKVPDTRTGRKAGETFDVAWVDIEHPELAHSANPKDGKPDSAGVFMQGKQQGGSAFGGLEGCWFLDGRVFFTAKSGGDAKRGQIWEYIIAVEQLRLVYESRSSADLNMPDNIVASPRGGLVVCEDGEGKEPMRLQCLTREGKLCVFGVNNIDLTKTPHNGFGKDYRDGEWAGATFSPDGKWLFVNHQSPGITFAITGPWKDGLL